MIQRGPCSPLFRASPHPATRCGARHSHNRLFDPRPGLRVLKPRQPPRRRAASSSRSPKKAQAQPRSRRQDILPRAQEGPAPPPASSVARATQDSRSPTAPEPDAPAVGAAERNSCSTTPARGPEEKRKLRMLTQLGEPCLDGTFLSATPPPLEGLGSGIQDGVAEPSWAGDELSGPKAARPLHHQHRRPHGPGRPVHLLPQGQSVGECGQAAEVASPATAS